MLSRYDFLEWSWCDIAFMTAPDRKLFLGACMKRVRRRLGLTQTAMARDLDVSPSYLNHIERNQRPVSAQLLLKLAGVYDIDLRTLGADGAVEEADLAEVFADPLLVGITVPRHEILHLLEEAPAAADALLRLHRAVADTRGRDVAEAVATPADWVRDHVQARRNHFPELDEAGAALHAELSGDPFSDDGLESAARSRLRTRHNVAVRTLPAEVMVGWTRRFDLHRRRLLLSETLAAPSRAFAVVYQLVLMEHAALLNALVDAAAPPDEETRRLFKVSLANALTAATLMPYAEFHRAAEESGYDLSRLQARFGVSFEQAAHRLTTLSKPGLRGVPFFLMRVDQAGNVSKRFASEAFPFARSGGACPRWRLHSVFATPGRIVTQIVETPDGRRWFTLSRTVERQGHVDWARTVRTEGHDLAIGIGCELSHAGRLIYSKGLDLGEPDVMPIGPTCRLCHRHPCAERAAPPIDRPLAVDDWSKSVSPYPFQPGG